MQRLPKPWGAELERLAADRRHGASWLTRRAARIGLDALEQCATLRPSGRRRLLQRLAGALTRAGPSFGGFHRVAHALRKAASGSDVRLARRELQRLHQSPAGAARRLRRRLAGRLDRSRRPVVTMSRSSTVVEVLSGLPARRKPAEVRVLRSLPGGEGAAMVSDLRRAGVRAVLYEDSRRGAALQGTQAVIVGADLVFPDGALVHKVGTRPLARLAARLGVPVLAVADGSKRIPEPSVRHVRLGSWFDRTPARLVGLLLDSPPRQHTGRPSARKRARKR